MRPIDPKDDIVVYSDRYTDVQKSYENEIIKLKSINTQLKDCLKECAKHLEGHEWSPQCIDIVKQCFKSKSDED